MIGAVLTFIGPRLHAIDWSVSGDGGQGVTAPLPLRGTDTMRPGPPNRYQPSRVTPAAGVFVGSGSVLELVGGGSVDVGAPILQLDADRLGTWVTTQLPAQSGVQVRFASMTPDGRISLADSLPLPPGANVAGATGVGRSKSVIAVVSGGRTALYRSGASTPVVDQIPAVADSIASLDSERIVVSTAGGQLWLAELSAGAFGPFPLVDGCVSAPRRVVTTARGVAVIDGTRVVSLNADGLCTEVAGEGSVVGEARLAGLPDGSIAVVVGTEVHVWRAVWFTTETAAGMVA